MSSISQILNTITDNELQYTSESEYVQNKTYSKTPTSLKDIKFKLVKGEFSNTWLYDGTKYMPPVAFSKHYVFDAVNQSDSKVLHVKIGNGQGERHANNSYMMMPNNIRTQRELKQWILGFDYKFLALLKEQQQFQQKEAEAGQFRQNTTLRYIKDYQTPQNKTPKSKKGQIIEFRFLSLSKPNSIGDAIINSGIKSIKLGKVDKTLKVSNMVYDEFVENIYATKIKFDPEIGGVYNSDTAIEQLHEIISPNRQVIYVNSEGYQYARYIGLDKNKKLK